MPRRADGAVLPLVGAEDTIAAVSSATGRGAIAVVRVSGPAAHALAARLLTPWRPEPGRAWRAALHDPERHELIDRPVVTVYAAPRSYTGEDLVELSVHGGALVPALALRALLAAGAREALPGEFTRRAVAAGKMDLVQAEAVADLVDAGSRAMHRAAVAQLDGHLSRRIAALRAQVVELEALLAYDVDFPEEDDGPVAPARIAAAAAALRDALDALLATAGTAEMVRAGATVVIAGAPNTGKSSLFNTLLGAARAIVTDVPGTTRDAIEAMLEVGRWPVRLVDTAGLRASADVVERLGIEVSERYLRDADLVLACGDTPAAARDAAARVRALTAAPVLVVRTKVDLVADGDETVSAEARTGTAMIVTHRYHTTDLVAVSVVTGSGLDALAGAIEERLTRAVGGAPADVPLLSRERHRLAVGRACVEVTAFAEAWAARTLPATVAAVHLRAAATALESVIGVVDVDDVLDRVFSAFCVGK